MITLFHHPEGPSSYRVRAMLCVSPSDIDELDETAEAFFAEALAAGRQVGCIVRYCGGNSYFSYAPWQQPQLEISLLTALTIPKAETYVTQG